MISGTLETIDGNNLSVDEGERDADGQRLWTVVHMNPNTPVVRNGKRAFRGDLKVGDHVTVTIAGTGPLPDQYTVGQVTADAPKKARPGRRVVAPAIKQVVAPRPLGPAPSGDEIRAREHQPRGQHQSGVPDARTGTARAGGEELGRPDASRHNLNPPAPAGEGDASSSQNLKDAGEGDEDARGAKRTTPPRTDENPKAAPTRRDTHRG